MRRTAGKGSVAAPAAHSDLARLIETEQRLAAQAEEAHRQAEAVRTQARENAGTMERTLEEELAALLAARAARAGEQLRLELEGLVSSGGTATRRYETLSDEQADRLARRVLQLIAPSAGVAP